MLFQGLGKAECQRVRKVNWRKWSCAESNWSRDNERNYGCALRRAVLTVRRYRRPLSWRCADRKCVVDGRTACQYGRWRASAATGLCGSDAWLNVMREGTRALARLAQCATLPSGGGDDDDAGPGVRARRPGVRPVRRHVSSGARSVLGCRYHHYRHVPRIDFPLHLLRRTRLDSIGPPRRTSSADDMRSCIWRHFHTSLLRHVVYTLPTARAALWEIHAAVWRVHDVRLIPATDCQIFSSTSSVLSVFLLLYTTDFHFFVRAVDCAAWLGHLTFLDQTLASSDAVFACKIPLHVFVLLYCCRLVIFGRNCSLAASRADHWWVMLSMRRWDRQTDGRTQDHYITLLDRCGHRNKCILVML